MSNDAADEHRALSRDGSWWSLRDIELELGRPVVDAALLIAVREMRQMVDDIEGRMRTLAASVDRLDREAQDAIIERGEDPEEWSFEPDWAAAEISPPA